MKGERADSNREHLDRECVLVRVAVVSRAVSRRSLPRRKSMPNRCESSGERSWLLYD